MPDIPAQFDAIIVGSGAAGLAAAVTLAEGDARVAVLEKRRSLGGTSNFFQGIFAVGSDMQRAQYITYSPDEAFQSIMDFSHWRANPRLVRAIVDESGPTIAWLRERGVEFSHVTINMPDSPRTYHVIRGRGAACVRALVKRARDRGAAVLTSSPVTRIFKKRGRVAGVVVSVSGRETEIAARAIVIASGGYANNAAWVKKYTGFDLDINLLPVGNTDKTGDGLRMAWEAGAAEEGVGLLELYRVAPTGREFAMGCQLEMAAAQPDLWVDAAGRRFCDESVTFYDSSVGNASARLPGAGFSFTLLDSTAIERMRDRGIDKGVNIDFLPGTRLAEVEREIEAALARGSREVFAADSIEELAAGMGANSAMLRQTVDEYNRSCVKGRDDLFAKEQKYLRPLTGPRFYAVRGRTVFLGTMGGIKINEKAEAVDAPGNAVPGLYAAGLDAGGMYGDSYPIKCASGLAGSFALNSGRIAGKNALVYLRK